VRLQNIDVIVRLFQTVSLGGLDALQQLTAVKYRFGFSERVGGSGPRFAFGEGEAFSSNAKRSRFVPGTCRLTSTPSWLTLLISYSISEFAEYTLSPAWGIRGGSELAARLRLVMIQSA
jgi:hypothetical protein